MTDWLVIVGYGISLTAIFLFSVGQLHLAVKYRRAAKLSHPGQLPDPLPQVTIQLPVYNELYVAGRLMRQVCRQDYPKNCLEIQVLDDSTDETADVIDRLAAELSGEGYDISVIRRKNREGYKAGALQNGLQFAKGEFIAIFDSDFLPAPDFLKKTLPHFFAPTSGAEVGMVQTRWGHLNQNYSLLTRLQAFGLDAHFTVEQAGRQVSGSFINFNGTGGVWRKRCIEDAGGWSADTLTEDLDLSYRAQLRGWKFRYLEQVVSPAELPIVMPAVKSQQYRWNKGAAETARKHLGAVLTAKLPPRTRLHALQHLLSSSLFLFIFSGSLLSLPLLFVMDRLPGYTTLFNTAGLFTLGFLFVSYFYWVASNTLHRKRPWRYYISHFPLFITFAMGLSLHNAVAVAEGWLGIKTPFLRTPKFNVTDTRLEWASNKYVEWKLSTGTLLEGLLALYFAGGLWAAWWLADYGLFIFHGMLAAGFGSIFLASLKPYGISEPKN